MKIKPCVKCGSTERGSKNRCLNCARAYAKKWAKENPDRVRETNRRWKKNNAELNLERSLEWQRNNPEKANKRAKRWVKNNPEKRKKTQSRWWKKNKSKAIEYVHKRRSKIEKNGGSFSDEEWDAVVKQQGGRCLACGKKKKLTVDHVVPLDKGGSNNISNIQGLCRPCNSSKGTKTIDYR